MCLIDCSHARIGIIVCIHAKTKWLVVPCGRSSPMIAVVTGGKRQFCWNKISSFVARMIENAKYLKQFIRSAMHSFSMRIFLFRFRSFLRWRSSFSLRRASLATSSFSGSLLSIKNKIMQNSKSMYLNRNSPFGIWFTETFSSRLINLLIELFIQFLTII